MDNQTIAFIGPGVIAEAMISGILRKELSSARSLIAAGPRQERLDELINKYHIHGITDNAEAARQATIVALTVKPQRLDTVLEGLSGSIQRDALVLSSVAGAPIEKISSALHHPYVVRAMPNTPAQIGQGITVWTASPETSEHQKSMARQILGALGEDVFMDEEYYLDMATALSGTGPAYVFLFLEAMVDAGVHLGFPRRIAEKLVTHTMLGSVNYYLHKDTPSGEPVHLAYLRNQVTSPGGTSAAALYYLEKAGFRTALSRAIWAAYERSLELGQGHKVHAPDQNS